jgi:hypothetical protein
MKELTRPAVLAGLLLSLALVGGAIAFAFSGDD